MTDYRNISENYHKKKFWDTKDYSSRSFIQRAAIKLLSFKHYEVAKLADKKINGKKVLDIGCGNGSYLKWYKKNSRSEDLNIIGTDISFTALQNSNLPDIICADANVIPLKDNLFDEIYTIDTLGHIKNKIKAIKEIKRIGKKNCMLFIHTETADYRNRWPDKKLIRKNGYDIIADIDKHIELYTCKQMLKILAKEFEILKYYAPAGLLGWLIGYPQKYYLAFKAAKMSKLAFITKIFSILMKIKFIKLLFKIINNISNRIELLLKIEGGGSLFVLCKNSKK